MVASDMPLVIQHNYNRYEGTNHYINEHRNFYQKLRHYENKSVSERKLPLLPRPKGPSKTHLKLFNQHTAASRRKLNDVPLHSRRNDRATGSIIKKSFMSIQQRAYKEDTLNFEANLRNYALTADGSNPNLESEDQGNMTGPEKSLQPYGRDAERSQIIDRSVNGRNPRKNRNIHTTIDTHSDESGKNVNQSTTVQSTIHNNID